MKFGFQQERRAMLLPAASSIRRTRFASRRASAAFTLIELLVVIAIIGILAAVGLPKIQGFTNSNKMTAATRQLLDDVAQARAWAISRRSDVYMVFVPPSTALPSGFPKNLLTPEERTVGTNVITGQYTTYALFSDRSVGDQPGRSYPRYLTSWKSLPNGIMIATNKFAFGHVGSGSTNDYSAFRTNAFPFPLDTSRAVMLPYIGFDSQGRVFQYDMGQRITARDDGSEILALARGSIFYDRDNNGYVTENGGYIRADVVETPPGNSVRGTTNSQWNWVRVDGLTGRARAERQTLQ